MTQQSKSDDIDRIVASIDATRAAEHWRNPDRPDSKFVKRPRRQDPAITRAKSRLRTADWRNRLDRCGAATTAQIGMAMIMALVTSDLDELTDQDHGLVGRALTDLRERGFSIDEVRSTLRRLRHRVVE